jgi:hypothetical protein
MFPQLLAVVAIYLIILRVGDVFPHLGNKPSALIVII